MLLQKEGVKLPSWVKLDATKQRSIKHTDKLRRNQIPEPVAEVEVVAELATEAEEAPVEAVAEVTEEASDVAEATEDAEPKASIKQ